MNIKKTAICIISYEGHFRYVYELLKSISTYTTSAIPKIFIFVDSPEEKISFSKYQFITESKLDITCLSMSEVIGSHLGLQQNENFEDAKKSKFVFGRWSANNNRDWVATKRIYSLIYLYAIEGYDWTWCLDSESLFIGPVNIENLIKIHSEKPILFVCEDFDDRSLVRFPYESWILSLFGYDLDSLNTLKAQNVGLRQNDFWFIHNEIFYEMIVKLNNHTQGAVSSWVGGSEQWLYEKYLYINHILGLRDISLISLKKTIWEKYPNIRLDFHNMKFFREVLSLKKIDIESLAHDLNREYFHKTLSYRGDYIRRIRKLKHGKKLLSLLEINIAVSNYQQRPDWPIKRYLIAMLHPLKTIKRVIAFIERNNI